MTADLSGEDGSEPPQGDEPMRDNPPLPADLIHKKPSNKKKKKTHPLVVAFVATFVAGLLLSPPVTQAANKIGGDIFGIDQPIELSPICTNLGGIVAPHAQVNAAHQWRCVRSHRPISQRQIEQRCATQWGPKARLVLRNPNSASGWACHTPGLLP